MKKTFAHIVQCYCLYAGGHRPFTGTQTIRTKDASKEQVVLPVEYYRAVITDVEGPDIECGNFRIPVQILMDFQHRYVTRKCASSLQVKEGDIAFMY